MNLRIPPPPGFGKKLSLQKGRQQKSDYVPKRVQFTSEKVKIIEVLYIKENN